MFRLLTIIIIALNISYTFSNIPEYILNEGAPPESKEHVCVDGCCKSKYSIEQMAQLQGTYKAMIYDVLNYNLEIDISTFLHEADINIIAPDTLKLAAQQNIKLRIDSAGHKSFTIDAVDMIINKIEISSSKSNNNISYDYDNVKLTFSSIDNFELGDTIDILIDYAINRKQQRGIYFYGRSIESYGDGSEPIIYTQGQPSLTRYWMPCNDKPYDKAITSVNIIVPKGYTALSNGDLDAIISFEDGEFAKNKFQFVHTKPLSPYLTTIVASRYSEFMQYYPRHTNNLDTVEIRNYMWDIDINPPTGHPFNGRNSLKNQPEMLRYYSSVFGEYEFDSYGTVAVFPYMFGGMEHQTMTTIHRNWLRYFSETGLSHEVAHHWIGNLITCATWDDIWINEGGATWCEALWYENAFQDDFRYYEHMTGKANFYFSRENAHLLPVYGVPESQVFVQTHITYNKAGWVYHMLSEIVGREKFFNVMNNVFENNKFLSVSTADFIELLKKNIDSASMNLDLFFQQWVYDSGHPIYSLTANYPNSEPGKYIYEVYVNQIQNGTGYRDVYEMPLDLLFYDENGELLATKSVYNDQRTQEYTFEFDFPVKNITVDSRKVLCKVNDIISSFTEEAPQSNVIIAPNPSLTNSQVNVIHRSNNLIKSITIYDNLGRIVYQDQDSKGISTNSIVSPNISGVYHVLITEASGKITASKLIVN